MADARLSEASADEAPLSPEELGALLDEARKRADARARRRARIALAALLATLALGAALAAIVRLRTAPFDPREAPTAHALAEELAAYSALLGRDPDASAEDAERRVVTAAAARELGPAGADALRRTVTALSQVARHPADRAASDALLAATGALNAAMSERALPYFVDPQVFRVSVGAQPIVYAYYIDRVRSGEAPARAPEGATTRVKVLHLWRIDSLVVSKPALGYTRPQAGAALVLLDQVERELVDVVLPALAPGEGLDLLDRESRDAASAWQRELSARAGDVVRASFRGAEDEARLARLGELLTQRRKLVARWTSGLQAQGLSLREPTRLVPDAAYEEDLSHRVPRKSLEEWAALHKELLGAGNLATFERLRDRFASATERHEVQHRLDYARGLFPVPRPLAARLGIVNPLDVEPTSLAARARDEASAYLAQMAEAELPAALTLVTVSRFLFDRALWGDPYSYAALAVLDAMADEATTQTGESELLQGGGVRRERVAERVLALTDLPDAQLRDVGRRAYQRLFGDAMAAVTTRDVAQNRTFRH